MLVLLTCAEQDDLTQKLYFELTNIIFVVHDTIQVESNNRKGCDFTSLYADTDISVIYIDWALIRNVIWT